MTIREELERAHDGIRGVELRQSIEVCQGVYIFRGIALWADVGLPTTPTLSRRAQEAVEREKQVQEDMRILELLARKGTLDG